MQLNSQEQDEHGTTNKTFKINNDNNTHKRDNTNSICCQKTVVPQTLNTVKYNAEHCRHEEQYDFFFSSRLQFINIDNIMLLWFNPSQQLCNMQLLHQLPHTQWVGRRTGKKKEKPE